MSKRRIMNSKVTTDGIYGLIGYVVQFGEYEYLIRDYNWEKHGYLLQRFNIKHANRFWVPEHMLIGCNITKDRWEALQNGKI